MYCNIFKEDFDGIPLISLTEEFNVWNLEPEPRCLSPNLNVSLPQVNIFKVIIKYITPVNHVSDYKFFVCAFKSHRA